MCNDFVLSTVISTLFYFCRWTIRYVSALLLFVILIYDEKGLLVFLLVIFNNILPFFCRTYTTILFRFTICLTGLNSFLFWNELKDSVER
mmetsp:Transcript_19161/g.31316  ORF Transcript_19161/g.31316 Transcript_19161/m.31316 type:complete len:90 (+) Transcript_19161:104-373(+)